MTVLDRKALPSFTFKNIGINRHSFAFVHHIFLVIHRNDDTGLPDGLTKVLPSQLNILCSYLADVLEPGRVNLVVDYCMPAIQTGRLVLVMKSKHTWT